MSLLSKDSIKIIGETVGIASLSDEVAAALASDVEYRIREIAQEALKFMRHSKRDRLLPEDINNALRLRNVEPLYGFSSAEEPIQFVKASGTNDLFYIEDRELDFNEVINGPLPPCPLDVSLTTHWLAVEGVQPAIRQNPSPEEAERALGISSKKRKSSSVLDKPIEVKPIVKHVLSRELQLYYEKITSLILSVRDPQSPAINPQVDAALKSLSHDPGLHQLLPYFTQFISDEVTHNLRNLRLLRTLMRMVRALLDSPYLKIEPYLHQLMPAVLTCLVGKRLCEEPTEDHWGLRDYCASLVAYICRRFGNAYKTLQPRITKTLLHAFLDPTKPLTTHYGAVVGLSALGLYVIQLLILPNLTAYHRLLAPELNTENPNRLKLFEAQKVNDALLRAAGKFLFESSRKSKITLPLSVKSEEGKDTAEAMDIDSSSTQAGGAAEASGQEIEPSQLFPDVARHYKELREIFGEGLDTYITAEQPNAVPVPFL